jgi:hypothetical protein
MVESNKPSGADRRRSPRYPFIAAAEIIEVASGTKLPTRVSELGLNGCYLEMTNPLPQGTAVVVKIFPRADFFEAPATVAYSHPDLGLGLEFHDVKPFFHSVLKKWLLAAMLSKTS